MRKHGSIVCKWPPCLPKGPTNYARMRTILTAALQRQYLQTELILWICLIILIVIHWVVTFVTMYVVTSVSEKLVPSIFTVWVEVACRNRGGMSLGEIRRHTNQRLDQQQMRYRKGPFEGQCFGCLLSLVLGSDWPAFLFQHVLWKLLSDWHN